MRFILPVAFVALVSPQVTLAQVRGNNACMVVFNTVVDAKQDSLGEQACRGLAGRIVNRIQSTLLNGVDAASHVSGRDLHPASSGRSSAAGSVAQSEVVPSGQPVALAGGAISVVGSDAGADAITSLTFNPSIFFTSESGEGLARGSRLSDVTVFFPVDNLDRDDDGDVDYFGLRLRVNFTGLSAGSQVWNDALSAFGEVLRDVNSRTLRLRDEMLDQSEARVRSCAEAAFADSLDMERVAEACGDFVVGQDQATLDRFHERTRLAREEADSKYFGLDVRLDFGDPTLGAVENAEVTGITAGLGFGRQFASGHATAASLGFRGRAGVRYVDSRDFDETAFSLDGGVSFVLRKPLELDQALTLSGGLEFRFGDKPKLTEGMLQSEFLSFRAALSVPVTATTAISVSFGHPLIGEEVSSALSVSADWKLLLPSQQPGK